MDYQDAMQDYLLSLEGYCEKSTVIYKRSALRMLGYWLAENGIELSEFKGRHFDQYMAYRKETGSSDTTRYHDFCVARCFLDYCRVEGYISDNPLGTKERAKKHRRPPHRLQHVPTDEDVKKLLHAAQTRRRVSHNPKARYQNQKDRTYYERWDYPMIMGYVETGCRLSELCKLRLNDVDFTAKTITFRDTKTDEDRTVPVSDKWLESVKRYLTVRPKVKADTLFVTSYGNPVDPGWMCDKLKDYAEYAGVPECTAQAIRRWRLTRLAHDNILVASLIGGNSVGVIRRHYLKPDLNKMREVMDRTLATPSGRGKKAI